MRLMSAIWARKSSAPSAQLKPMVIGLACRTEFQNASRSEEHTSELQSRLHLVCRLLLEKKKKLSRLPARPTRELVVAGRRRIALVRFGHRVWSGIDLLSLRGSRAARTYVPVTEEQMCA